MFLNTLHLLCTFSGRLYCERRQWTDTFIMSKVNSSCCERSPKSRYIYHLSREHPDSNMLIEVKALHCSCLYNLIPHYFLICLISTCSFFHFIHFYLPFPFLLSVSVKNYWLYKFILHSSITPGWRTTGLAAHPCIIFTETLIVLINTGDTF